MSPSTTTSTYKPSPLGLGTPRSSPFRRPAPNPNPDSPAAGSASGVAVSSPLRNSTTLTAESPEPRPAPYPPKPTVVSVPTTPSTSPTRATFLTTTTTSTPPTRTASEMFIAPQGTPPSASWTPRGRVSTAAEVFQQQQHQQGSSASLPLTPPAVPRHSAAVKSGGPSVRFGGGVGRGEGAGAGAATTTTTSNLFQSNALARLQPLQMRMLRDSFEVLDRDGDGVVNREDVADMLAQLGLPADASSMSRFFPPSSPQTTTLAAYLNGLATSLVAFSPGAELVSAFSAFDDDDSGQADVAELRDALLHTTPDPGERALTPAEVERVLSGFSGRRAFTKSSMGKGVGVGVGMGAAARRGDVFRYQEFVGSVTGANHASEQAVAEGA